MTDHTEYTAVVDRIVDGETAVFIVEEDGNPIEQLDIPMEDAPPETAEGEVFTVAVTDEWEIVALEHEPGENEERLERNRDRLNRLSEKLDNKRDSK